MEIVSSNTSLSIVLAGIIVIFFAAIVYGLYASFGAGSKKLVDTIGEHARMHELGIAHGHGDGDKYHRH